jgi:hypothetical protein
MANEVSICNLALAHLGDRAAVTSISPPDQSAQASLCAQFYPFARDATLALHNWGFAKRRGTLAEVNNPSTTWAHAYAVPANKTTIIAVLDANALDDYSATTQVDLQNTQRGSYTPRDFDLETVADGTQIVLTNTPDAVCRYTVFITDPAQFDPLFTLALSWLLASMLAGPVLKGERGSAAEIACLKVFNTWLNKATGADANERQVRPAQQVTWMNARG